MKRIDQDRSGLDASVGGPSRAAASWPSAALRVSILSPGPGSDGHGGTRLEFHPSESREDDEPLLGVKFARLVSVAGGVTFAPRYLRQTPHTYQADAEAVCESDCAHRAPSLTCRCGFYAVASRAALWRLDPAPEVVVLDVELAGTVIEHKFGWRAGHQSVLGVHLPAECTAKRRCRGQVVGVAPYRSHEFECDESSSWIRLRGTCERCSRGRLISVADLAGELGVEVTVDRAVPRRERRRSRRTGSL